MTSIRENAETEAAYIGDGETLRQTGHRMRQLKVAALPVCGEDGTFQGIITRALVAGAIAAGGDPQTVTVGEVASKRWSPPSAISQVVPAFDARERCNRLVVPVTGDDRRTREAIGRVSAPSRMDLRIDELASALRAATEAVSRLGAATIAPDPPARRSSGALRPGQQFGLRPTSFYSEPR